MLGLISRFRNDEGGATATEYAMLIVFVARAIAVGAQALGNDLTTLFTNVGTTLKGIPIPTPLGVACRGGRQLVSVSDPPPRVNSARGWAMQSAVLIVAVGILGIIAYGDVGMRRIPNALSLAIATLGLARIALARDPVAAGHFGSQGRWFQIGARHARVWARPSLTSLRACRSGSLRRPSVRLSDGATTSVERCPLLSAEFPVALLQSQNRRTERRLKRLRDWLMSFRSPDRNNSDPRATFRLGHVRDHARAHAEQIT
jgi:pilus assembly protein Flp/PilA